MHCRQGGRTKKPIHELERKASKACTDDEETGASTTKRQRKVPERFDDSDDSAEPAPKVSC